MISLYKLLFLSWKKIKDYFLYIKEKYYIIDIKAYKNIGTKGFFPKDKGERKFHNSREEGPFQIRITVMAEDFQFKEQKIVLVKPIKKITEEKRARFGRCQTWRGSFDFLCRITRKKIEEKGLSDSDDDE